MNENTDRRDSDEMELRDLFAKAAIEGSADATRVGYGEAHAEALARDAYAIADAMMRERLK